MSGLEIFTFAFLIFAIILLLLMVKTVPQGYEYTVERFGEYTHTLRPGLHFIIPIMHVIGAKMNMMETVLEVPSQEVITKDNAMVKVDGVVFFQVLNAAQAAYEVNNLTRAIMNLTTTNIRTVMGSMDLDELLSKRDEINAKLLHVVDEATTPWGTKVTRIEIKAEGEKQGEILRADGDKQAAILEAEGRRESAFRDAEARERLAQAEAKATTDVSNAIASGNIHAINYFVATKYVDALKDIASAPNQKVILMPLEAGNVIGALGGITEIAKETFGKSSEGDSTVTRS
jgi:regulator of protease activity HflC (stomatin/prohibitin superfamily)